MAQSSAHATRTMHWISCLNISAMTVYNASFVSDQGRSLNCSNPSAYARFRSNRARQKQKSTESGARKAIDSDSSEIEGLLSDLKRADARKSVKTYLKANHPRYQDELFGDAEDDGFQTMYHNSGKVLSKWFHPKLSIDEH